MQVGHKRLDSVGPVSAEMLSEDEAGAGCWKSSWHYRNGRKIRGDFRGAAPVSVSGVRLKSVKSGNRVRQVDRS